MNTYFPFQVLGITFHGSFDALGGTAGNLATLVRTGDCTVDIDNANGILVVSGNLGLTELFVSNLSNLLISFDRKKKSSAYSIAVTLRRGETNCNAQYTFFKSQE
jgi:hypothetical protein